MFTMGLFQKRTTKDIGREVSINKAKNKPLAKEARAYKTLNESRSTLDKNRRASFNNSGFGKFLAGASRVRQQQNTYGNAIKNEPSFLSPQFQGYNAPKTVKGRVKFGRGRPKGTYDQRYAAYGGVYGYRKAMSHARAMARLEAMRRTAVTPQQEQIIRNIEARRMAEQSNPENQTIPDTKGEVRLRSIHQEIDDYSRIFD